jgi:RHS repeat-associated protein
VGTYVYDPAHPHAVKTAGSVVYENDAVGNQIERPDGMGGTFKVAYTPFDVPAAMTPAQANAPTVLLEYDGMHRRVRKETPAAVTVSIGDLYDRVTDKSSGVVEHKFYVYSAERVVAVVSASSNDVVAGGRALARHGTYLHVDNVGSLAVTSDDSGQMGEKRSYDPFGAPRATTWGAMGPPPPPVATQGFGGQNDDVDLGLVDMRGRLYDPKLARFLSADPIVTEPFDGQRWDRYGYVRNDPLSFVDPSGFQEVPYGPAIVFETADLLEKLGKLVGNIFDSGGAHPAKTDSGPPQATKSGATPAPASPSSGGAVPYGNSSGTEKQPPAAGAGQDGKKEEPGGSLTEAGGVVAGLARAYATSLHTQAQAQVLNGLTGGMYGATTTGRAIGYELSQGHLMNALSVVLPINGAADRAAEGTVAANHGDLATAAEKYYQATEHGTNVVVTVITLGIGGEGLLEAGASGSLARGAAVEAADAAQGLQPRPGAAAALELEGGRVFTGVSGTAHGQALEGAVQRALDTIPNAERSAFHGMCAETQCISQALRAGANPRGGVMSISRVRSPGNPGHGTSMAPCPSCARVLEQFGIRTE